MDEDMNLALQRQATARHDEIIELSQANLHPKLHHLIPDYQDKQKLAQWFQDNKGMLTSLNVRQIAIDKGFLKG